MTNESDQGRTTYPMWATHLWLTNEERTDHPVQVCAHADSYG